MKAIIVGAGKLALFCGQLFLAEGHEIVFVDLDQKKCENARAQLGAHVVLGDATSAQILEQAGAENADVVLALTKNDDSNVVIGMLAKELGSKRVVARSEKIEFDELQLKKLGVDLVVHPNAASAGYIFELATKPQLAENVFISQGKVETFEAVVLQNSFCAEKKVFELGFFGSAIFAQKKEDGIEIIGADQKLFAGMKLFVLAKKDAVQKVKKVFE